jgi:hypothetical protein
MKSIARIAKMLSIMSAKNESYDQPRAFAHKLLWEQVHLSRIRRSDAEYILNLEDSTLNQMDADVLLKEINHSISAEMTCLINNQHVNNSAGIFKSLKKIQNLIKILEQ